MSRFLIQVCRRWRPCAVILCVLVAGLVAQPALGQERNQDLILAASRKWLDGVGSVLLTYESETANGQGMGRRTIGFDPVTGAWFVADFISGASGRTADGVCFGPKQSGGSMPTLEAGPVRSEPLPVQANQHVSRGVDRYIPVALLVQMQFTSAGLHAVERDVAGNWVVSYEGRSPDPEFTPLISVTFAPDGIPLHYHADADPASGRKEVDYEFEIEPQSPPGLPIVRQRQVSAISLSPQLVDVQYYPKSRPNLFTMESAEAIANDNRIAVRTKLFQVSAQGSRTGSDRAPYVRTRLSGAGWPLIVTGVVVVGLGIAALWRTRVGR